MDLRELSENGSDEDLVRDGGEDDDFWNFLNTRLDVFPGDVLYQISSWRTGMETVSNRGDGTLTGMVFFAVCTFFTPS